MMITSACSTVAPKRVSKTGAKILTNPAYHDGNIPPDSMQPPSDVSPDKAAVDPLYLSTQADYHFTLGEAYSLEGFVDKAIEEFKLVLLYDPHSPHVRLRLGAEYLKKGLISEALAQIEHAVREHPENADGRLLLGGLYASLKMYEKAQKEYETLIKTDPKNRDAYLHLGALYAEQQKYAQSIEMFKKLTADKEAENPHLPYYYIARVYQEQKDLKRSEENYKKTLEIRPDFEDGVMSLARLYEESNKKNQMTSLLETFQDKHGPSERVADTLGRVYLEDERFDRAIRQFEIIEASDSTNLNVKVKIALILIEQKDYLKATAKLKQILAQAPDSDKIRFYLGAIYEEIKDYDSAIEQFAKIPPTSSFYTESVVHAAYLHKVAGRMSDAVKMVETAIEANPDVEQFYSLYASFLHEDKAYTKAVTMLEKATLKFPKSEQLHFFLGSMYDKIARRKDTIRSMKTVLELNAEHAQALNYLAYTYAEMGESLNEAEELARRAVDLKPDDAYIQDTLGWVLFKQGRYSEAIKTLELAYKIKSDEAIIAEHLGDAYYRFQLPAKAKLMYQKAVENEKDEETIRKIRSKITALEEFPSSPEYSGPSRMPASEAD
ncbi:MAG TPA: tetratricopeptide repeat protein [Bdellovibrionales bacterium]|nr:tetratricopeptide repeat protein [Bdellovibrionales bacterium]